MGNRKAALEIWGYVGGWKSLCCLVGSKADLNLVLPAHGTKRLKKKSLFIRDPKDASEHRDASSN